MFVTDLRRLSGHITGVRAGKMCISKLILPGQSGARVSESAGHSFSLSLTI